MKGRGSSSLTNRESARSVASNCGEETNYIATRHPEKLSERSQLLALWQQICCPGQKNLGSNAPRSQRHRYRDRKSASQSDPLGIIREARATFIDIDDTDEPLLKVDG